MNILDILKSMLFLCSTMVGMLPHAAHDNIIRRIIINNLCLLTLSQQIWELILGTLIIFWIADSYIAINTLTSGVFVIFFCRVYAQHISVYWWEGRTKLLKKKNVLPT
jgi:hypothetical protein